MLEIHFSSQCDPTGCQKLQFACAAGLTSIQVSWLAAKILERLIVRKKKWPVNWLRISALELWFICSGFAITAWLKCALGCQIIDCFIDLPNLVLTRNIQLLEINYPQSHCLHLLFWIERDTFEIVIRILFFYVHDLVWHMRAKHQTNNNSAESPTQTKK